MGPEGLPVVQSICCRGLNAPTGRPVRGFHQPETELGLLGLWAWAKPKTSIRKGRNGHYVDSRQDIFDRCSTVGVMLIRH